MGILGITIIIASGFYFFDDPARTWPYALGGGVFGLAVIIANRLLGGESDEI